MTSLRSGAPLRFLIVGAANTLISLSLIYACKWFLGFGDASANFSGYAIALGNSFVLNRGWTFGNAGPVFPALGRFLLVFAVAYLLNLATVFAAIALFDVNSYVAHILGIVPYTVFFYLGSRHFAFRSGAVDNYPAK
jgi:putative flippase GtrA